jgi:phosphoribosyl 1,2-cyclic phosphate phosphodiesterase
LLETATQRVLIDAGLPDLAERFPPGSLSRILLTHYHADHVQGLLPLRWGVGAQVNVIGPPDPQGFDDLYKHPGIFDFARTAQAFAPLVFAELKVTPLPLVHSRPALGYCLEVDDVRIAYLTDTAGLPPATRDYLRAQPPDVLVLDCSHPPRDTRPTHHNDVRLALEIHAAVRPVRTVFTHLSHEIDAWRPTGAQTLPVGVEFGSDGLVIEA